MGVRGALSQGGEARLRRALAVALVIVAAGGVSGSGHAPQESPSAAGEPARAAGLAAARAAATAARTGSEASGRAARQRRRGGRAHYGRIARRRAPASVKAGFLPLYREAARTFGVSWRLIASIHRQETAFSTAPSTYHGLNAYGCCAGPMQFNVKNGPVSTWKLYRQSFRLGDRPRRYPHRTRKHPSVYDDFDAIMAAGALLRDSGATEELDRASWYAAYAYYGHDLFGVGYASQVMGRALGWELDGFCVNCPLNDTLVAAFDGAYGLEARRELRAADRRAKQEERKKQRSRAKAGKRAKHKAKRRKPPRRPDDREKLPIRPAPAAPEKPTSPPPATTTPASPAPAQAPPQPAAPAPEAEKCTPLSRLLGCGR
jgi:hypothetical protein